MYSDTLTRLSPLAALSDKEYQQILELVQKVTAAPGEVIIEEGSEGASFFIVMTGGIDVYSRGTKVASLEPGAILGEMSLFNDNIRVGKAVAVQAATLFEIQTAEFWPLVLHNEPAAVKLMESLGQIMTERLQRQDAKLVSRVAENDEELASLADAFAPMKSS